MLDLDDALRRYFDDAAIPVDFEQTVSGRVPLARQTRSRLHPGVAFALGVLVAAVALLPLVLLRSDPEAAVVATTVPAPMTGPTVATVPTTAIDSPATGLIPAANPRLVGWFSFDGSAKNLADPSGASDGEAIEDLTGSTAERSVFTPDRFGNPESAFDSNGAETGIAVLDSGYAHVEVPMTDDLRLETGTVSAWVKPVGRSVSQTWWFDIVSFGPHGYTLGIDGYHRPTVNRISDRDNKIRSTPETDCIWTVEKPLAVDEWYHLAMVFDGQHVALYVDGIRIDLRSNETGTIESVGMCDPAGSPQGTALYVGNNPMTQPVNAVLDEVLIYDAVLSPEAITALADDRP